MQYVLSEGIIILCQQYQGLTGVLSVEKLTKNDDDPGLGYCYGDTEEVTLELLDYDEVPCHEDWIEIVAHELIHVKQHLLGELVDKGRLTQSWLGTDYISLGTLMSFEQYVAQPWEAQAYAFQSVLADAIKDKVGNRYDIQFSSSSNCA